MQRGVNKWLMTLACLLFTSCKQTILVHEAVLIKDMIQPMILKK